MKILVVGKEIYSNFDSLDEIGVKSPTLEEFKGLCKNTVKTQLKLKLRKTNDLVVECMEEGENLEKKYPIVFKERKSVKLWAKETDLIIDKSSSVSELENLDLWLKVG